MNEALDPTAYFSAVESLQDSKDFFDRASSIVARPLENTDLITDLSTTALFVP